MRKISLALFIVVLAGGCTTHAQPSTPKSPGNGTALDDRAKRLVGSWRVDIEATRPHLEEILADAKERNPLVDINIRRDQYLAVDKTIRYVFTEERFETWAGDSHEGGRYSVTQSDGEFVVLRLFDDNLPQYHDMTLEQIIERLGLVTGNVPQILGVEFIDDDHFRLFGIKVRNRKITEERNYAHPVFERVNVEGPGRRT